MNDDQFTHRVEIGQDRDDEQRHSIEEANKNQPPKSYELFASKFCVRLIHVVPDLMRCKRRRFNGDQFNTNNVFRIGS
jgi:hypothetical protein